MKNGKLIRVLAMFVFSFIFIAVLSTDGVEAATKVKLSATEKKVKIGEKFTLKLKNAEGKISWKSSDKKIATVKNGVVTPLADGTVKITAKNNGKKYICNVTVKGFTAKGVDIQDTGIQADIVFSVGDDRVGILKSIDDSSMMAYILDMDGNILVEEDYYAADGDGLLVFDEYYSDARIEMQENGLMLVNLKGYYNSDGSKAFSLNFDNNGKYVIRTSNFKGGIAVVTLADNEGQLYDYLVNEKGRVLAKVKVFATSDSVEYLSDPVEGMCRFYHEDEDRTYFMGYFNNKGKFIELKDENGNCLYESGWDFSEGLACVLDAQTGLEGFINKKGKLVIPCIYEGHFGDFYNGYVGVLKTENGKQVSGVIDKKGRTVIPFEYDDTGFARIYNYGMFSMTKDGKNGIITPKGKVVIPFEYGALSPISKTTFLGIKDGTTYLMNGKEKILASFDESYGPFYVYPDYDVMESSSNGKRGVVSYSGKTLVDPEYDDITDVNDLGIIFAVKDGEMYIITLKAE